MEICARSKKYADLARKVIRAVPELRFIRDTGIKIAYVESDRRKIVNGRTVYADCRKTPDLYYPFVKHEFIITVYEPNVEDLNDNQVKLLLLHELLHVGIEEHTQEVKYIVNPHDYEEFKYIADRYGLEWSEPGADVPDITAEIG